MICPNCSNAIDEAVIVCPKCGKETTKPPEQLPVEAPASISYDDVYATPIAPQEQIAPADNLVAVPKSEKNNQTKLVFSKIKLLALKYKKPIIISFGGLMLVIICVNLFGLLFGFTNMSWDKKYADDSLKYVTQTNTKLGVLFADEDNIDKIKYSTNCGDIKYSGLEVSWDLSKSTGKCSLTASYKLRKITKEFNVIAFDIKDKELSVAYDIDVDSDDDLDLDNLTNKQEKQYKTNPESADSDIDGLDDDYEIFTSKTDPNKKDSDDDGLGDYDEIELKLNPLLASTKQDGIKDGDRLLTYESNFDGVNIKITGKGNIASTVSRVSDNTKISNRVGLVDRLYSFHTDGNMTEAIVTIPYTIQDLEKDKLNEDNLSIYYFNTESSKYEKIETTVNKTDKKLTAKLTHFSNYVVGDSSLVKEVSNAQILFLLDNSWSMYTNEQFKEITGEDYSAGLFNSAKLDGYDSTGQRFTLTSELIAKLSSDRYKIGLSEFREDYANALPIGSATKLLNDELNDMNGKFITKSAGTNINNALTKGIQEFSSDGDDKFIVILTDGQDSTLGNYYKKIIEAANSNNVKICSIGFGGGSYNDELSNISSSTGCKFYSSTNVDGLSELFSGINTELNNNLIDLDGDSKIDGMLIADSGFVVNRDGFSFGNYGSNLSSGGHCYGLATFAQLYYQKKLPIKLGAMSVGDEKGDKSYAYDLSGTYFGKYSSLYDYSLKTNGLKYSFGFDVFGEENPSDLRTLVEKTLVYSPKHKTAIEAAGIYQFTDPVESSLDKTKQLEKYGFNYKDYIDVLLDEDKMQKSDVIEKDDKQMFNAIYAAFIKQDFSKYYASSSNLILKIRHLIGTETIEKYNGPVFVNILKTRLDNKDAPVLSSTFGGGLHAINAISLIQDINNPNFYYIGVYDNNYPGEKRYVGLECKKDKCSTRPNSYYSNDKEPVRITATLEDDLSYYNK